MPAQLKEPNRALQPMHWIFSSTPPSCTVSSRKNHQKELFQRKRRAANGSIKLNFLFQLTWFHPFHGLHKNGWTLGRLFIVFPRVAASLLPFEAFFTLTGLMGKYMLLWGNNSSTFLTAINQLRFWFRSKIRNIRCCHFRLAISCLLTRSIVYAFASDAASFSYCANIFSRNKKKNERWVNQWQNSKFIIKHEEKVYKIQGKTPYHRSKP